MYTVEKLKELGFEELRDENTRITDFVKIVSNNVRLVLTPQIEELFVWIIDEDASDEDMDGTKIILDTSNLEEAISFCEIIVGVE